MSVVIIGGNDCMHGQYKEICSNYGYRAKVFTQIRNNMKSQIGDPDLIILFTNTVSHAMVNLAVTEARRKKTAVERCHSSSASALKNIMEKYARGTAYAAASL
ncbi:MAG: DUF2325 domain-containing protein [Peptococcaceae bacterium]|nr:DUF2325 domain-containing protein [Peptococcaceae bacterium]